MSKSDLKIDWATYEAAKYACQNWHYSGSVPAGKLVKLGAWEKGEFIGVVLFGRGATPEIGSPYDLGQDQICELVRVALRGHIAPVSRIVAVALRFLRDAAPGLRLAVSFADSSEGHHGGIYQAGGWVYAGFSVTHEYVVNGARCHPKTLYSTYGKGGQSIPWLIKNVDPDAKRVHAGDKHRYLMPLDAAMRTQITPLAQPYPKRDKQAMAATSGTAAVRHRPSRSIQSGATA